MNDSVSVGCRSYDPSTDKIYHELYRFAPDFDVDDCECLHAARICHDCMGAVADGDGIVSRLEFQCAHGPENLERFVKADTQEKGHLTRSEYVAAFGETTYWPLHVCELTHIQSVR